jgi:hypothetical protein
MDDEPKSPFEQAGQEEELSLYGEFVHMLKHNKKYWMVPLLVMLLGFGVLLILGATGAAPFIYTLF